VCVGVGRGSRARGRPGGAGGAPGAAAAGGGRGRGGGGGGRGGGAGGGGGRPPPPPPLPPPPPRPTCSADMPILRIVSFFGGRLFSTSALRRRSRKGRKTLWSWETTSVSSPPAAPSPPAWNQASNASDEENISGSRKWSRAHSSCRLFCRGVPGRGGGGGGASDSGRGGGGRRGGGGGGGGVGLGARAPPLLRPLPPPSPPTGDQQAVRRVQLLDHLEEDGLLVLDAVRLVDDDVLPFERGEHRLLLDDHLVRRHAHVERPFLHHGRLLRDAVVLGAVEFDGPDHGAPLPKLVDPVVQRRLGHDDEVGPRDAAELVQVAEEGDGLQGFAEAHLAGAAWSARARAPLAPPALPRPPPAPPRPPGCRSWSCRTGG